MPFISLTRGQVAIVDASDMPLLGQFKWHAHRKNKTGARGVFVNHGRFTARIKVGSRRVTVGTFATLEQARQAYAKSAALYHGTFAMKEAA